VFDDKLATAILSTFLFLYFLAEAQFFKINLQCNGVEILDTCPLHLGWQSRFKRKKHTRRDVNAMRLLRNGDLRSRSLLNIDS